MIHSIFSELCKMYGAESVIVTIAAATPIAMIWIYWEVKLAYRKWRGER